MASGISTPSKISTIHTKKVIKITSFCLPHLFLTFLLFSEFSSITCLWLLFFDSFKKNLQKNFLPLLKKKTLMMVKKVGGMIRWHTTGGRQRQGFFLCWSSSMAYWPQFTLLKDRSKNETKKVEASWMSIWLDKIIQYFLRRGDISYFTD